MKTKIHATTKINEASFVLFFQGGDRYSEVKLFRIFVEFFRELQQSEVGQSVLVQALHHPRVALESDFLKGNNMCRCDIIQI